MPFEKRKYTERDEKMKFTINRNETTNHLMKQKLFILQILLCFFALTLSAQTEKGKFSLSGSSSMSGAYFSNRVFGDGINSKDKEATDLDGYSITITPSIGYFVIDNLSVGGQVSFTITDGDYQNKACQFILMPTVAYYIPTGKPVRPFVALGAGYANVSIELGVNGAKAGSMAFGGFTWGGGAGAAFFVSDAVSIDLMAEYAEVSARYSKDSSYRYSTKGLGGSVGLSFNF